MTPFRKELLLLINYAEQILMQFDTDSIESNQVHKNDIRLRKEHLLKSVWPSLEDETNIAAIDLLFSFQQFIDTTINYHDAVNLFDLHGKTVQMTIEVFLQSIDHLITTVEGIA
jgi:hypothetical protein